MRLHHQATEGPKMTKYMLPEQPPVGWQVTDKDGDLYVCLLNEKGFPRWYLARDMPINVAERSNWTWPNMLSAFGPLTLVEAPTVDDLYGSAPNSGRERRYCLTCGLLVWDTDLHTARHKPETMKTAAG
jgi:hypothetical protein